MRRFNVKRGFDRLYVVLIVLWCIFVLLFPFKLRRDADSFDYKWAFGAFQLCNAEHEGEVYKRGKLRAFDAMEREITDKTTWRDLCEAKLESDVAAAKRRSNPDNKNVYQWTSQPYYASLLFSGLMLGPPLILYIMLLGIAKLFMWIINGFRNHDTALG